MQEFVRRSTIVILYSIVFITFLLTTWCIPESDESRILDELTASESYVEGPTSESHVNDIDSSSEEPYGRDEIGPLALTGSVDYAYVGAVSACNPWNNVSDADCIVDNGESLQNMCDDHDVNVLCALPLYFTTDVAYGPDDITEIQLYGWNMSHVRPFYAYLYQRSHYEEDGTQEGTIEYVSHNHYLSLANWSPSFDSDEVFIYVSVVIPREDTTYHNNEWSRLYGFRVYFEE